MIQKDWADEVNALWQNEANQWKVIADSWMDVANSWPSQMSNKVDNIEDKQNLSSSIGNENLIFGNKKTILAVNEHPLNQNWVAFQMSSIGDARLRIAFIKAQMSNTYIKNVYLQIHGSFNGIGLKGKNISVGLGAGEELEDEVPNYSNVDTSDLDHYFEYKNVLTGGHKYIQNLVDEQFYEPIKINLLLDKFKAIDDFVYIGNQIELGGNLILGGCNTGLIVDDVSTDISKYIAEKLFSYRINIISNQDFTRGTRLKNVKEGNEYKKKFRFLDIPRTFSEVEYLKGWRVIDTKGNIDNSKKTLILNSNGVPFTFRANYKE